jgi:hypothetical protein
MRFDPETANDYRANIGEMLNALHPLYASAQGTSTQDQIVDRLENARRQLEAIFKQIPAGNGLVPSYIQTQFQTAQDAWDSALRSGKELGFTSEKSFGGTVKSVVGNLEDSFKRAVDTGEGISGSLKAIAIGGLAIGALVAIAFIAGRK